MTAFTQIVFPATGVLASAVQPAAGAGRRNVLTQINALYNDTAGAIITGAVVVLDGAVEVFRQATRSAGANQAAVFILPMTPPIIGSINTSMTVQFTLITATGQQVITMRGIVV